MSLLCLIFIHSYTFGYNLESLNLNFAYNDLILLTSYLQTIFAIIAFAAVALADNPAPAPGYDYPDVAPLYTFGYNVNNKDGYEPQAFQHDENRDGYQTHGEYSVALPDGRTQIVTYRVDGDSGFIADVRYEGEARPYEYHPKPAPAYKPAPAPVVYKPAPVIKPAPVVYKPAPVVKPAPIVYKPAPLPAPIPAKRVLAQPVLVKVVPAPVKPERQGKEFGPVRFNPFGR